MPEIAEHRFDRGKASPVTGFAFFTVDGPLHPVAVAFFLCVCLAAKEGNLPDLGLFRGTPTFLPLFAGQAIAQSAAVFGGNVPVVNAVRAVAIERLAGRAGADAGFRIEGKILRPITLVGFLRVRLVVEWIGFLLVPALVLEAFITLAHAVVGNQGVDVRLGQFLEVALRVVAGIGGVKRFRSGLSLRGAHDRQQQFLF